MTSELPGGPAQGDGEPLYESRQPDNNDRCTRLVLRHGPRRATPALANGTGQFAARVGVGRRVTVGWGWRL